MQNVKAISAEFQHALAIADIDKKEIRKVVKRAYTERRKISFLNNVMTEKRF